MVCICIDIKVLKIKKFSPLKSNISIFVEEGNLKDEELIPSIRIETMIQNAVEMGSRIDMQMLSLHRERVRSVEMLQGFIHYRDMSCFG